MIAGIEGSENFKRLRRLARFKHFGIYFLFLALFGYLTFYFWGSYFAVAFLVCYSQYGPTVHLIGMKHFIEPHLRIKDLMIFYYISSYMANMEPIRWRWSHTFHQKTHGDYDHEIQLKRPTDLIHFFCQFIPFGQLLYPHKTLHAEIIKHSFGSLTDVVKQNAPENEKLIIIRNSRIFY